MLVHRRVTLQQKICRYPFTPLGHNTMSLARARSGMERINVEASAVGINGKLGSTVSVWLSWSIFPCSVGEKPFSVGFVDQTRLK